MVYIIIIFRNTWKSIFLLNSIDWERYEYISIGSKNKLTLVRKCTKPGIMFNYFKELLDKFAGH
jgi:hypothetical protein